jgi:Transcriptional regulator
MLSQIELLRTFIAAAESSSFKDAAAKIDSTPQAVSRAIKELESQLGEHLFYRTTRMIKITDYGRNILSTSKQIVGDVDKLFSLSSYENESDDLVGVVKISSPIFIGRHNIKDVISDILKNNNKLVIELTLNDQIENFVQSEIDIGIRVGEIENNGYVTRKLTSVDFLVVASPSLADELKLTADTVDFDNIPVVLMKDAFGGGYKPWIGKRFNRQLFNNIRLISNDQNVICDAVCQGVGVSQIPALTAAEFIQAGKMVAIDNGDKNDALDVYLYRPQSGPVSKRVRYVFDEIASAIGKI